MFRNLRRFRPLIPALLIPSLINHPYRNDFRNVHPPKVQVVNHQLQKTPLYPPIKPYNSGFLKVSDLHTLYYEESGNPNGKPVVILHGGPGGGSSESMRCFHNPQKYRIIIFDQRGCGKSTPHACLEHNTTWDLVSDIERLREHLKVEKWQVFGGSWGSTLALAYSIKNPNRCTELVLRGIFMLRNEELQFFYQHGSSYIYPEYFDLYKNFIEPQKQNDLICAYRTIFTKGTPEEQLKAAQHWTAWEMATSRLFVSQDNISKAFSDTFALQFAKIENHYFYNRGFFDSNEYLLDNVDKIKDIKTVIVQGRYDLVCPMRSAWDLQQKLVESELKIIPDAGHSAMEDGIISELVNATDRFSEL